MPTTSNTREALIRRRDEILAELDSVNKDLRAELDRNPEEQAIQIEQDEVAVTIENHLRQELAEIEDKLLEIDSN